jgi:hypothetical protein
MDYRDNAAHLFSEAPLLTDGVHYLAQQVLVRDFLNIAIGEASSILVLKALDLDNYGLLESVFHRGSGLKLRGVN